MLLDSQGEIIHSWEFDTDKRENGQHIAVDIARSIEKKLNEINQPKSQLVGIGAGVPGPVNVEDRSVDVAVNLGWRKYPLKDILERETSFTFMVDNDANLAALGEM